MQRYFPRCMALFLVGVRLIYLGSAYRYENWRDRSKLREIKWELGSEVRYL